MEKPSKKPETTKIPQLLANDEGLSQEAQVSFEGFLNSFELVNKFLTISLF